MERNTRKQKNTPEALAWRPFAIVRKYDREGNFLEERRAEGNLLTTSGRTRYVQLLAGEATFPLDADHVRVGVGDNGDVADPSDTNLSLGSNEYYQVVEAGYPVEDQPGVMVYLAEYGDTEANFTWNCWGFDVNDAGSVVADGTPVDLFNRKVFDFGTKDGGTWQLTVGFAGYNPAA